MTSDAVLSALESAVKADLILPGLPATTYPSDDSLDTINDDRLMLKHKAFNRDFGFCLITAEVLFFLAAFLADKKTLEAGSGSGWLADQLAQRGVDITAADWADYRLPPRESGRGYPIRSVFRLDHHGDAVALLPGNFDAVMLIWPNYDTPFAENVAKAMKSGQILIYEGEDKGGNAATDAFFDALTAEFAPMQDETIELNKNLRTFPRRYDRWQVLRKK